MGKLMESIGANIPGMEQMTDLMKKMETASTQEEMEVIKNEMDSYLQNSLGVDVNKLNGQLENVMKETKENTE
jgi:hypothetical protein